MVDYLALVTQRIRKLFDIIRANRVMAESDRGTGTFAGFGVVGSGIAFAKLSLLAEDAVLAL